MALDNENKLYRDTLTFVEVPDWPGSYTNIINVRKNQKQLNSCRKQTYRTSNLRTVIGYMNCPEALSTRSLRTRYVGQGFTMFDIERRCLGLSWISVNPKQKKVRMSSFASDAGIESQHDDLKGTDQWTIFKNS